MSAIYRQYDQAALDIQYNARATTPEFTSIMQRYADESRIAQERLKCSSDVAYGTHPDEVLDVFHAERRHTTSLAPVLFWIHGGYWRMQSKNDACSMAPAFVKEGVVVVVVNYSLAPTVSLDEIVEQNRRALAWVYHNVAKYGGDPERICVGGSSAGGHLAAMMLARGWRQASGLPENLIKTALLLSGLYDLTPLPYTFVNEWLRLSSDDAIRNSPDRLLPEHGGCPIIVSYGDSETDEFKRQSTEYLRLWQERGFPGRFVHIPGLNHFDIVLELGKFGSPLTQAVLEQMELM